MIKDVLYKRIKVVMGMVIYTSKIRFPIKECNRVLNAKKDSTPENE